MKKIFLIALCFCFFSSVQGQEETEASSIYSRTLSYMMERIIAHKLSDKSNSLNADLQIRELPTGTIFKVKSEIEIPATYDCLLYSNFKLCVASPSLAYETSNPRGAKIPVGRELVLAKTYEGSETIFGGKKAPFFRLELKGRSLFIKGYGQSTMKLTVGDLDSVFEIIAAESETW